ncbi:4Fe-4S dicluster domain-containing protein, partial [Candidatus Bathyarchaeota archaeon]|nr:4Fe-4S dicluster domain-containing protein [Candidatus Bathyarchaeota archaeon]
TIIHKWEFEQHVKYLKFWMEKCVGCDLCRIACPTRCITLGPVPEIASGQLEMVPPINVDFEACAYCGLCAAICPVSAFEMTTEPTGFISMDDLPVFLYKDFVKKVQEQLERSLEAPASKHVTPPTDIEKPSEGEVVIRNDILDRCDPMGCKGCLNICPTDCFWVPRRAEDIQEFGKITMDDDLCIHCGACKNACPERIIEVHRNQITYHFPETVKDRFWMKAYRNAIKKLLDPAILEHLPEPIPVKESMVEDVSEAMEKVIETLSPERKAELEEKYEKVKDLLSKINVRYWIEMKKLDKLNKMVEKNL